MIRQPGQPLRHFAELLINMQIQIQIPAGRAVQQIFHGGGVPVGGVDEAAQQAALSAVGDRPGDGLRLRRLAKQGQRDQRHPLQGEADGIEAGDLLPGVRRVGGKPVDMAAQMGHAIRCRPGQRGGRSALNIRHGPVSAILMHGVDRRQQPGLRWTAAFNSECLVQMGMGFHQAGSVRAPARSHRPGVGWSVGVSAAIRLSRKARSASSGSPLACVGQPSGSAQAGSRARLIPVSGAQEEGSVIVSLLTDPKPDPAISPANSRA